MALVGGRFSSAYVQSCAKYNSTQQPVQAKLRSYSDLDAGTTSTFRHAESRDSSRSGGGSGGDPLPVLVSFINPNYEPPTPCSGGGDGDLDGSEVQQGTPTRGRSRSENLAVTWRHEPDRSAMERGQWQGGGGVRKDLERVRSMEGATSPPRHADTAAARGRSSTLPLPLTPTSNSAKKEKRKPRALTAFGLFKSNK